MNVRNAFGIMVLSIIVWFSTAQADQNDPKALAKAQYMLRQFASERDALQAENTQLKADIVALKKKTDGAFAALHKSKETTAALDERLQKTETNLNQTLSEKQKLEKISLEQQQQFNQCTQKNAKLYDLNHELVQRYADKGVLDALVQREPFTGLKRVQVENVTQDLQDKLDEQRIVSKHTARASEPGALITSP